MRVVINACYGGFGLSPEAELRLHELGCKGIEAIPVDEYFVDGVLGCGRALKDWRKYLAEKDAERGQRRSMFIKAFTPDEKFVLFECDIARHDELLIRVVEEMGEAANGACAKLRIVEIPDGVDYEISEYEGMEHVAEKHRTWC